jgi:hypothetical protein
MAHLLLRHLLALKAAGGEHTEYQQQGERVERPHQVLERQNIPVAMAHQ